MTRDFYHQGRSAVKNVLRREYLAHRSLWIGALFFVVLAAVLFPLFFDHRPFSYLHAVVRHLLAASLLISAFVLWALYLLQRSLESAAETFGKEDKKDYIRGVRFGIFFPALTTAVIIIVVLGFLL